MGFGEALQFLLTALLVLGIFFTGLRWIIKHYVSDLLKELKPNGGSSIKDQVVRLEKRANGMDEKLDKMYDMMFKYVSGN